MTLFLFESVSSDNFFRPRTKLLQLSTNQPAQSTKQNRNILVGFNHLFAMLLEAVDSKSVCSLVDNPLPCLPPPPQVWFRKIQSHCEKYVGSVDIEKNGHKVRLLITLCRVCYRRRRCGSENFNRIAKSTLEMLILKNGHKEIEQMVFNSNIVDKIPGIQIRCSTISFTLVSVLLNAPFIDTPCPPVCKHKLRKKNLGIQLRDFVPSWSLHNRWSPQCIAVYCI